MLQEELNKLEDESHFLKSQSIPYHIVQALTGSKASARRLDLKDPRALELLKAYFGKV